MIKIAKSFIKVTLVCLVLSIAVFSQRIGVISGEVLDTLGDAVVGATVTVTDASGKEKNTVTNNRGGFRVNGLVPGKYSVRVVAENFAEYVKKSVNVKNRGNKALSIVLKVEAVKEEVEVSEEGRISIDAANNASALVLKEKDLEALPDDPDDLEAALRALAAGGAGPNGGQIYIDGFEGGNLPPKEAIREIRINNDPFSAEYDRLGFGRIEIFTKPGSSKWRGQAFFRFNDDAFNARNPFSDNKADSQQKSYGGYISGPIIKNKAAFSLSINNRDNRNGSSIRASVIDPNFNIVSLNQELTAPSKRFYVNPRFDYQLNETNTLVARYTFQRRSSNSVGGGFSLPTQGIETASTNHTIQLTETAILNANTVNETRFQYRYSNREQIGDNSIPRINVQGAFVDGGTAIGLNFDRTKSWELQNYTTTSFGKNSEHSIKFGVKLRGRRLEDRSESNFNGTFTFAGFISPIPNNPYDLDNNGFISSIEQYRAKLLGEVDPLYNPTQFSISTGNPLADISQYDVGLFVKDDWRISPKLNVSFGLRYENQTNINDSLNFAPRFGFAYSPGAGGAKAPKTVFRGGIGIFYTRFSENLSLQAVRLDGTRQQQFIITGNDAILGQPVFSLNGITNVPTAAQLAGIAPLASTPRIIASDLQSPYTIQGAFSFERQLPGRSTFSVYYVVSRNLHLIRSRNINAPVCPTGFVCPINDQVALQALRPDPTTGNIYQYESSGVSTDQRLIFGFRTFFSQKFILFTNYFIGRSKGNSGGFPAYSYDLSGEVGNSSRDIRHTFFLGGSIGLPYGLSLRPFILGRSGSPFNITTGSDLNGDSIFNDRPTFAQLGTACVQNGLTATWCDISGNDPNAIIPRNFGRGPASFTVNLGLDKTFGFGSTGSQATNQQSSQRGGRGRRRGNVFSGGQRGRGSSGGSERKPYRLTVGVRFRNLLNTTNENNPVGNINSPLFGESTDIQGGFRGGARRIQFQTRFRW